MSGFVYSTHIKAHSYKSIQAALLNGKLLCLSRSNKREHLRSKAVPSTKEHNIANDGSVYSDDCRRQWITNKQSSYSPLGYSLHGQSTKTVNTISTDFDISHATKAEVFFIIFLPAVRTKIHSAKSRQSERNETPLTLSNEILKES
jgi:hypothetical protein